METSINKIEKVSGLLETYSEPSETSKMELSAIVDCIQPLTIFAKHFILGVSQGYEYVPDKAKQIPGASPLIPQKIRTAISANYSTFKFNVIFTIPCDETLLITNSINASLISNWFARAVEYIWY